MILYAVQYNGIQVNYSQSIVTIWKTKEAAQSAMNQYIKNITENCYESENVYNIIEIDTDKENCIYDYEWYD